MSVDVNEVGIVKGSSGLSQCVIQQFVVLDHRVVVRNQASIHVEIGTAVRELHQKGWITADWSEV